LICKLKRDFLQETAVGDSVSDFEINSVHRAVDELLLLLCTSSKKGILFRQQNKNDNNNNNNNPSSANSNQLIFTLLEVTTFSNCIYELVLSLVLTLNTIPGYEQTLGKSIEMPSNRRNIESVSRIRGKYFHKMENGFTS